MRGGFVMKELQRLKKKFGLNLVELPKGDLDIKCLFVIVSDTRKLHDSGYPFIRIFGEMEGNKIIDLCWYDHYLINIPIIVYAYGKNLFRIMPGFFTKGKEIENFKIKGRIWFCSIFEIDEEGVLK